MSATPKLEPTSEELEFEEAGKVTVRFEDVVDEGMIKTEVVINKEIGKYANLDAASDEIVLAAALEKQEEIRNLYEKYCADIGL